MAAVAAAAAGIALSGSYLSSGYTATANRFEAKQRDAQDWANIAGYDLGRVSAVLDRFREVSGRQRHAWERARFRDAIPHLVAESKALHVRRDAYEKRAAYYEALRLKYRRLAQFPFTFAEPDPAPP
jgi:hypothetical protein